MTEMLIIEICNMKKLIIVLLLISSNSFGMSSDDLRYVVRCVNGYEYLFSWGDDSYVASGTKTITVVQMFKSNNRNYPPQPISCESKK